MSRGVLGTLLCTSLEESNECTTTSRVATVNGVSNKPRAKTNAMNIGNREEKGTSKKEPPARGLDNEPDGFPSGDKTGDRKTANSLSIASEKTQYCSAIRGNCRRKWCPLDQDRGKTLPLSFTAERQQPCSVDSVDHGNINGCYKARKNG